MNRANAVFHYAVVRFMPFVETREFANIGVVLVEPKTGKFIYKLAPKKFGRVTQFFEDLDGKLYKNGIDVFTNELARIQEYFVAHRLFGKAQVDQFKELIRRRESVVHFSEMGRIAGDDPRQTLDKLYERFVSRSFVTKHYREQQMVKVLKQRISDSLPIKFTEKTLKAGVYDIKMPLTHRLDEGYSIIKPLAFEQQTALKAAEHGETWVKRVERLVKHDIVKPEHALFTIERPKNINGLMQVYEDVLAEIEELGVKSIKFDNLNPVIDFVKSTVPSSTQPFN
ncbi:MULTISPECIES: DUF3037 domain-containing protein [Idiomarina]|mgnify:CR=1 FL=1|uniref:DUF3037 domain-containing protein n=1 Tax=Idiomarina TaxID=135575 RepID=UPI000C4770CB|nr:MULTISPECIES: DUF3037 domain-containing protein [Idiomarina]MBP59442.1 hypothetical protein [Idiomarina sp.]|tara:strand:- start:15677 stop:16525 length:849 start_codon:yes stop_codon:yes gene_type:complete